MIFLTLIWKSLGGNLKFKLWIHSIKNQHLYQESLNKKFHIQDQGVEYYIYQETIEKMVFSILMPEDDYSDIFAYTPNSIIKLSLIKL